MANAEDRRSLRNGADGARSDPGRGDGRDAHARAHPARHLELVEAAVLRLRHRLRRAAARHLDDRRAPDESVSQPRQLRPPRRQGRDRGTRRISSNIGGRTVVDPTNLGIGRDPSALQRISRRTGLNIVMGAGFYLEASHPDYVKEMSVDDDRRGHRDATAASRRTIRKSAPGSSARSASARISRPPRRRCCAAPRAPPR